MAISLQADSTLPQGYILVDGQRVASVSTTGGLSASRLNASNNIELGPSLLPTNIIDALKGKTITICNDIPNVANDGTSNATIIVQSKYRNAHVYTIPSQDSNNSFSYFAALSVDNNNNFNSDFLGGMRINSGNGSPSVDFLANNNTRMRINSAGTLQSPNGAAFYGAVSNSGNGAIMEQGTNGNGRYIRYADGTQICFTGFLTVTDQTINTPYGTLFQGLRSWTYPIAFAAPPSVNVNGQWGTSASWSSTTQNINSNTGQFRFLDNVSRATGTSFYYSAVAVGRWFL